VPIRSPAAAVMTASWAGRERTPERRRRCRPVPFAGSDLTRQPPTPFSITTAWRTTSSCSPSC
jgi:hypothetical protein